MSDSMTIEMMGTVPVFRIGKYFDEACGTAVCKAVDEHLCAGRTGMIIDFSGCKVINSPGIGKVLEVVMKVANDFQGNIFLCGLDSLKKRVFKMSTILPTAQEAPTVEEALSKLVPSKLVPHY